MDDPACWFKAAYWESVPSKSIFIHPVDYRTLGKAAHVVSKPNESHAGGCPACRAWKIVEHFDTSEKLFLFFPPSTFSLLSQIGQRLNGVRRSVWAAFRGRWHTGDESSCQGRCWGHTSQPQHVCEVSGMVLTSDARLQRTSSIRPLSLSQHTGGKERMLLISESWPGWGQASWPGKFSHNKQNVLMDEALPCQQEKGLIQTFDWKLEEHYCLKSWLL